jgi:exopolysaccharide production protein ExoZ
MLRTLQMGRALAAIAVAAFHLSLMMGQSRYGGIEEFRSYTRFGNKGVDFFFVLSGFIILFAHSRDINAPARWGNYVFRRFVRLYPIYWLYTLIFVGMLLALGGTNNSPIPTTFGGWISSLTLIRLAPGQPPIPVAWTLFHELSFYAVFSLLILNRRLGIAAFAVFVALPLFNHLDYDENSAVGVYLSVYNWFFVLGMGAFWLYQRPGRGLIELPLGLFCVASALLHAPFPDQFFRPLLVCGLALTLAGMTKLERAGWLTAPYVLALAGDASYTIYLLHSNLEGTLLKLAMKIHLQSIIGPGSTFFVVLAGTVALGCVIYLCVERPLLEALRRKWSAVVHSTQPPQVAAAAGGKELSAPISSPP